MCICIQLKIVLLCCVTSKNIVLPYFKDCPIYANDSEALIDSYRFWIEGVTQTSIAIPGFIGKVPGWFY